MTRLHSFFLSLLVRKRWRGFTGIDSDEFAKHLERSLTEQAIDYTHSEQTPTLSDRIGYGSYKDKHIFGINFVDENVVIEVTPAYADPILRGVFMLFTTQDRIEALKNLCIVDIQPITEPTQRSLADVMASVIDRSPHPLWDCSHHPRFVTGIILQYKTRLLWDYWTKSS